MPDIVQLSEDVKLDFIDLVRVVKVLLTGSATQPDSAMEKI
jgi:hypothetical protein